jgi:hypothetical protein
MTKPGFYSVVQFVPDIERGEAVNVGVIVGAPELGMRVRMAERNEYVKQWFGAEAYDDTRLGFAKSGLAERLKDVEPSADALATFRAQEAGQLQLTLPRPMVVKHLDDDVIALFLRLVSDPEVQRRERRTLKPDLRRMVRQLKAKNVPIEPRPPVTVPILDEPLTADFAFQNGARNIVKAVGLSGRQETALEEASDYGSKGLLIAKHPDPAAGKSKLILVADIDDRQLLERVERLLDDHGVRLVEADELPSFTAEVEREAH